MLKFRDLCIVPSVDQRARFLLLTIFCFLLAVLSLSASRFAAADTAKGEKLYRQCQGCHAIGPDAANGFGPHLNGIFNRPAGGVSSYSYSQSFNNALSQGLRWTDSTLDEFLAAPLNFIRGTRMAFPGISSAEDRQELIAYLKEIDIDGVLPETERSRAKRLAVKPPPTAPRDANVPEHGVLHLGRAAHEEEVAAWDIDVRPDGQGLPPGRGSVLDGTDIYDSQCAACHGIFGEGLGRWPILAGGQDTLQDERPEKTIGSYWPYLSTVFDYVRRAMPFGNARSLSDDDVYAVTAYLLFLNDIVDEEFELTSNNFSSIRLPNELNFISDNRDQENHLASAAEPCMSNCFDSPAEITQRARILDVTPDDEDEDDGGAVAID